jgi:site-specific DNA-methyltransferase (adenine-specific)
VLFKEQDGSRAAAQIKAFEDTWEWNIDAEAAYMDIVQGGGAVSQVMQAFRTFLGASAMMAYLAMMAPRLVELRRVLKPTGSIYLHCDSTASHYLKLLMDAVFGPENHVNEIIWKRTSSHSDAAPANPDDSRAVRRQAAGAAAERAGCRPPGRPAGQGQEGCANRTAVSRRGCRDP